MEQEFEERENSTVNANHVIQVVSHVPSTCFCKKKRKINRNVKRNHILTFFLLQNEEKEIKFEMPQNLPTGEFKDLELLIDGEKMHNFTKKEVLQNLVQNYKEREVNLERKLLKLNSLREETDPPKPKA